jgi:hypothetical protein
MCSDEQPACMVRVDAVHRDVLFTTAMTAAVDRESGDLARWLSLGLQDAAQVATR